MAVKIRLARKGRKRKAFYHIVVADSRAPRDGRFIEKLGVYNPITDPATIELDFDRAVDWLQKGAQPTDTCRAILSYKGVMLKKHLLEGVRKGAFDEAEAERRFQIWLKEKEQKIEAKITGIVKDREDDKIKRIEAEKQINEERAKALAKKREEMAAAEASTGDEGIKTEPQEEKVEEEAPASAASSDEATAEKKAEAEEKKEEKVEEEAPASAASSDEAMAEKKVEAEEKKEEKIEEKAPASAEAADTKEAKADKKAEEKKEEKAREE